VTGLERRIRELGPWFHNLVLDGIPTAPEHFLGDYPRTKFARFAEALPDLAGTSVLDVGCNAGFYAFEMKRRGAARVVGIDPDRRYLAQAALAAEVYGMTDIEWRELDVYGVAELGERFDVVLFMGVLYHLRYPLLALDRLFDHAARDVLVFQSMLRGPTEVPRIEPDYAFEDRAPFERAGFPAAYFIEHSYAADWTNWWIPNRAGVEAMLRSSGFAIERRVEDDVYLCRRGPRRSTESAAEVST
jgi:tRNA (mo5U34)-methyltransferase